MKLTVTLKDPDTLHDAISDEKARLTESLIAEKNLTRYGAEAEAEELMSNMKKFVRDFFEYDEYVTIVFDDVEKTATVQKV